VFGLVYVPMPPPVYAVFKDAELVTSINEGSSPVEEKVRSAFSNRTLVRLVQLPKAPSPRAVMLLGMVTLVRLVQP